MIFADETKFNAPKLNGYKFIVSFPDHTLCCAVGLAAEVDFLGSNGSDDYVTETCL